MQVSISRASADRLCRVQTPDGWQALIIRDYAENLTPKSLSYMRNWSMQRIADYCREHKMTLVHLAMIDAESELNHLQVIGVC